MISGFCDSTSVVVVLPYRSRSKLWRISRFCDYIKIQ